MAATPQSATANWVSRMQSISQKVQDGINAVQQSPTAAAAQHLDKYLQNTANAVSSGKMAAALNRVSLQDWKTAALAKVSRIGPGAQAAQNKVAAFMNQWIPFVMTVKASVRQMPNASPSDRIARMVANATQLAQFKRS